MLYVRPSTRLEFNPPKERKNSQQIHLLVALAIQAVVAQPGPVYQSSTAQYYGRPPSAKTSTTNMDKNSWERNGTKWLWILKLLKGRQVGTWRERQESLHGNEGRRGLEETTRPPARCADRGGHRRPSTCTWKTLSFKNEQKTSLHVMQLGLFPLDQTSLPPPPVLPKTPRTPWSTISSVVNQCL